MTSHLRRGTTVVIAGSLVVALAACTDSGEPTSTAQPTSSAASTSAPDGLPADGVVAWNTWQAQGLEDYHYDLSISCFCPTVTRAQIVVEDGEVVLAAANKAERGMIRATFGSTPTVEELYEWVATVEAEADEVTATYDEESGVPRAILVDYSTDTSDDVKSVGIRGFGRGAPVIID